MACVFLSVLPLALDLGQLGGGAAELLADGRQLVLHHLRLLPRLGQRGLQSLVVAVQLGARSW